MNRTTVFSFFTAALVMLLVYLAPSFAQDAERDTEAPAEANTEQPAEQDAPQADEAAEQPSADDVLQDLLRRRSENPLIEPSRERDPSANGEGESKSSAARALAGVAPGASEASLRREGQFVITRRGRMVRVPGDVSGWAFVFDADGSGMQDPPMYLMPCQLLEDMEEIVTQHGDSVVFVLSGQIYLYRGANYMMPTLMKLAPDRGNIE
ncbi:MAG: hypothetical protein WD294_16385 [Phycisphaeraceae bacterium]